MTQAAPAIEFHNVSFAYHDRAVVENLNFQIAAGEFVGVIGPNGSGKTTLLRLLLGLLTPAHGEVRVNDQPVQIGKNTTAIGYIPQKMSVLEGRFPITVREVVQLGLVRKTTFGFFPSKKDSKSIDDALEMVDLLPHQHRVITELSGGQQQRAFIAKALAGQPKILVLDEPTVGVDTESQSEFYGILKKLNHEHSMTIVLVSHDVDVVTEEVSTVLCLNKTLVYHGTAHHFVEGKFLEKMYGEGTKRVVHVH